MMNELQYRANLIMQLFHSILTLGIGLAGLGLIFIHTDDLAGWGAYELLVVVGVHTLIGGLLQAIIQPNMYRIIDGVHQGLLDYTLTKPEDSQLLVSVVEFQIWKLVDVFIGAAVLVYALFQVGDQVGVAEALIFVAMLLCGSLILYSFWLVLSTTSFWVVRVWSFFELFQSMYQAGRWPVGIYPTWLRMSLTFIVPVAFAVTVPAEALTARLSIETLALALGVTLASLVGSRLFWKFGLKHYSGASA
jgi:ABC-2 type transport system permease protein